MASTDASLTDQIFAWLLTLLPHHLLSRGMFWLTRLEWPPLKDLLIRTVIRLYDVDMREAAEPDPGAYPSFNAFFTRALSDGARPLPEKSSLVVSPADGALSQIGAIDGDRFFQAKGHAYDLPALLGGENDWVHHFEGGRFATIYLSPRDYHRVHMPLDGVLKEMIHIPGRLFSVSPATTRAVPGLFARNERVVCLFDSPAGPMAVILVGAIFVASIDTVWAGTVTPAHRRPTRWHYGEPPSGLALPRGAEMGRFNMGSTVILLFGEQVRWREALLPGAPLRMGQEMGEVESGIWI